VPDRGDAILVEFTPQGGHEQSGRRLALVLSPRAYNEKVGLVLVCPITSQVKGYPFEVAVPAGLKVAGVVVADQVKSLDWVARKAVFVDTLPAAVVRDTLQLTLTLLNVNR
jgi:mRNA interferase MazF